MSRITLNPIRRCNDRLAFRNTLGLLNSTCVHSWKDTMISSFPTASPKNQNWGHDHADPHNKRLRFIIWLVALKIHNCLGLPWVTMHNYRLVWFLVRVQPIERERQPREEVGLRCHNRVVEGNGLTQCFPSFILNGWFQSRTQCIFWKQLLFYSKITL